MKATALIAFAACIVSIGTLLSTKYTISEDAFVPSISAREDGCRFEDSDWKCIRPYEKGPGIDPGAVAWQEFPAAHFFHQQPGHQQSKWSPYIGSGYPMFIDGMSRNVTPSRIFIRFFPGSKARDLLIFFRFFISAWAFIGIVYLFGARGWFLFLTGLLSTQITYLTMFTDEVYMDVDALAPVLFLWLCFGALKTNTKKSTHLFYALGFALGVWIGLQSFLQAMIVYSIVAGVSLLISYRWLGKKALLALGFYSLGFLMFALPLVSIYLSYFFEMISTRSHDGVCMISVGFGLNNLIHYGIRGYTHDVDILTFFSLGGLLFLLLAPKVRELRMFVLIYFIFLGIVTFGFPEGLCSIKSLKTIGFARHLIFHVQSLFFLIIFVSAYKLISKSKTKKGLKYSGFFILAAIPFVRGPMLFSVSHLKGESAKNIFVDYSQIAENNVYHQIQSKSQNEDRRHFAPDGRLYPNFSMSFNILDLRILYGLYPKNFYVLTSGLFTKWSELPGHGHPDRFVQPAPEISTFNEDLQRLFTVHRVSLLSFSKKKMWLEPKGLYSQSNCQKLGEDVVAQSWFCPQVAGVGFFPDRVISLPGDPEILAAMKNSSPTELLNSAYVIANPRIEPAKGKVLSFVRTADDLSYELQVDRAGLFVVADTAFPGWEAEVQGEKTEIYRTNIAFKAVMIPAGHVKLHLQFKPDIKGF